MTYTAVVTRGGGNWLADVPELAGAHTFAQTLAGLHKSVREVIIVTADLPDDAAVDNDRGTAESTTRVRIPGGDPGGEVSMHRLDDGAFDRQAGLYDAIRAPVMLTELREGHRNTACDHGVGTVHDLQMDVRLRGVSRVSARGKLLPGTHGLALTHPDRSALQVNQRDVPTPCPELHDHMVASKSSCTSPKPTRLTKHVRDEGKL